MSTGPFIKFFPSDFLGGTSGLSPAERGVYITLLCLMFEADGPIERNDSRLARRCGAPKAGFNRILGSLIDEGKIIETDGFLSNKRAEKSLVDRRNRSQNATIAANEKWRAQGQKNQQNQQAEDAGASSTQCVADAKPEARSQIEDTSVSSRGRTKRATSRASQLPDDFEPVLTPSAQRVVDAWPPGKFDGELRRFRDHAADKGRTSKDWQAAFRTWLNKADEWMKNDGSKPRQPPRDTRDGYSRVIDERLGIGNARSASDPAG